MPKAIDLPVTVDPKPGESFVGYLDRVAAIHGMSFVAMLNLLDLTTADYGRENKFAANTPVPWIGYGLPLTAAARARRVLGITAEQLAALHLTAEIPDWTPQALDQPPPTKAELKALQVPGAVLTGIRICRHCYDNNKVVPNRWRLAPYFGCPLHRCLLLTHCTACSQWGSPLTSFPRTRKPHPTRYCWEEAAASSPAQEPDGLNSAPETLTALRRLQRRHTAALRKPRPSPFFEQITRDVIRLSGELAKSGTKHPNGKTVAARAKKLHIDFPPPAHYARTEPPLPTDLWALLIPEL